jgi:3-O-methylgallate 3,4-dioxygenase
MARIVLGLGSSHTPQLSTTIDWWEDHANRDRANPYLLGRDGEIHTYDDLLAHTEWNVDASLLTPEVHQKAHQRSQDAIAHLAKVLAETAPDALVVIGDDQEELFLADGTPTFAIYWGETIDDLAPSAHKQETMAAGLKAAMWAQHTFTRETYPVANKLALHLVDSLITDEFDLTQMSEQREGRSLGHAFTFPRLRMMGERIVPLVPIMINTYYAPNQPSPRRCYMLGRALRRAIESFPEDMTVAVMASGGLSHFVVDEEFDHRILDGLKTRNVDSLATIPRRYMRSGTSEGLNWIAAGGALEGLSMEVVDYVPAYRSTAGTGVGMAFALWH